MHACMHHQKEKRHQPLWLWCHSKFLEVVLEFSKMAFLPGGSGFHSFRDLTGNFQALEQLVFRSHRARIIPVICSSTEPNWIGGLVWLRPLLASRASQAFGVLSFVQSKGLRQLDQRFVLVAKEGEKETVCPGHIGTRAGALGEVK